LSFRSNFVGYKAVQLIVPEAAAALAASRKRFVAIADLHPTQVTIGMREVVIKRERWRDKDCYQAGRYLSTRSIPTILGPGKRHYMVDRHHLVRALSEEGVKKWPVTIIANESAVTIGVFWAELENRGCAHLFDDKGRPCNYRDVPKSITDLVDDPYRSLAGAMKRTGGYKKSKALFSEFRWAEFLRNRIEREFVKRDFDGALALAMKLATDPEAVQLPGSWGTAN
jgi:hypothetical protein